MRIQSHVISFVVTAWVASSVLSSVAHGCQCLPCSVEDSYGQAEIVFRGVVVERVAPEARPMEIRGESMMVTSGGDMVRYTIRVSNSWKCETSELEVVYSARDGAACGVELVVGDEYLFFCDLFRHVDYQQMSFDREWAGDPEFPVKTTGMCSGTKPIGKAAGDMEFLEALTALENEDETHD